MTAPATSDDATRRRRLDLLEGLYARQQAKGADDYLLGHATEQFIRGTEQVFDWYRPFLPGGGRLLDWGCRHAPDACLIAAEAGGAWTIDGCDVDDGGYEVFRSAAGMRYTPLQHEYVLPYETATFDAVIASGVLEHVPMEYESLKELSRVTKPGGVLVVTYLPNSWSLHEYRARRSAADRSRAGAAHHLRTYRKGDVQRQLQSCGFVVVESGYQTHFDLLPLEPLAPPMRRVISAVGGAVGIGRVAPCLAFVARRLDYF